MLVGLIVSYFGLTPALIATTATAIALRLIMGVDRNKALSKAQIGQYDWQKVREWDSVVRTCDQLIFLPVTYAVLRLASDIKTAAIVTGCAFLAFLVYDVLEFKSMARNQKATASSHY